MESPSGARLTSLGCYLFVSLVFAFLPIVEFALVLSIKEVKNRGTQGTSLLTNDKSKSKKEFLKDQMAEPQNTAGHVSPRQKVTGQQKSISWFKRPKFIASLPLTRQLDLLAFVMYHFVYVLFNLIYWTRLMISDKI